MTASPHPSDRVAPADAPVAMRALQDLVTAGAPGAEVLAAANRLSGQLNTRLGIELTEVGPERVAGTMPVEGNRQPFGLLHGGANGVLAESLGSFHAGVLAGPDRVALGIELSCTHHRSATDGLVHGVSVPLHVGGSVMTFEIVITTPDGRRVCTSRLTCLIRAAR